MTKTTAYLWIVIGLMAGAPVPAQSSEPPPLPPPVESSLTPILSTGFSERSVDPPGVSALTALVDFISHAPDMANFSPEKRRDANGSFIAFTIQRPLKEVIRYGYNQRIPQSAVNPSSVNFSYWKTVEGGTNRLPELWTLPDTVSSPVVVRGVSHESITPDLHTGAYYDYDLNRTLVFLRQGTRRIFLSLSDQIGTSEIGKKGFIVGNDRDWNYVYTQDHGIDVTGLGWVKSKIYLFFSMSVFIEEETEPGKTKVGVFQWLNAGWAGLNMVLSSHIRNGLERYADQFKGLLESQKMPDAAAIEQVYSTLFNADKTVLRKEVFKITEHIRLKAEEDSTLRKKGLVEALEQPSYVNDMNRHQLISMLVKEYIKLQMGKETPLSRSFWTTVREARI